MKVNLKTKSPWLSIPLKHESCQHNRTRKGVSQSEASIRSERSIYIVIENQQPASPSTHQSSLVAAIAAASPTVFKLRPLFGFPAINAPVGRNRSSHCRKAAFMSRGAPSSTTVLTGTNGRSCSDAARMP